MPDPPADSTPPRDHPEWLAKARTYLDDDDDIEALFQAMHYEPGLTFVLSDTDPDSQISKDLHYDLLAAHLNALAAATGTTVEGVAANAIKTSRSLSQEGVWSELSVKQSDTGVPELCLACGRPNGDGAADTSFENVAGNTWECGACGSTTTVPDTVSDE